MATDTLDTVATGDTPNREIHEQLGRKYAAGFITDIESDSLPPGLDEDTIRALSAKKDEPEWMTQWRLDAYRHFLTMPMPDWAKLQIAQIDLQALSYYSAPKGPKYASLDEVPKELLDTYDKLGVPLHERAKLAGVAVDAVFDSVSVGTTFRKELAEKGVIFCSMSEAIKEHPELVKQYLGTVVPVGDNYFAALNSAVFSDGSFVFIPKGVRCPMELSTYFRINAGHTGQFERTLIICEDKAPTSPTWKAAPRRCAMRTSCTPRWSSWWRWKMPRSSIRPCRTGTRATRTASAASTTSSPSVPNAVARAARSLGPRSRPARRSPGSTRPACCSATIRSANSIRSR